MNPFISVTVLGGTVSQEKQKGVRTVSWDKLPVFTDKMTVHTYLFRKNYK